MKNIITKLIETHKQNKQTMETLFADERIIKKIKVNYSNKVHYITVYYCPEMNNSGLFFGGATTGDRILVDRHFKACMDAGKTGVCRAVLNHEIGHIVHGDLSMIKHIKKLLKRLYMVYVLHYTPIQINMAIRDVEQEYRADKYAYDKDQQGTLDMLEYMYILLKDLGGDIAEIKDRYIRLGGTMEMTDSGSLASVLSSMLNNNIAMSIQDLQNK